MPIVLVHGVPETTAVWDLLVPHLSDKVTTLGLPGFGNGRPDGFGSTMDEYASWLEGELAALDGPVDLVGHDWGGILTYRLVTTKPGLIRSWVSDAVGAGEPGFEWHDLGKLWQTPGEGEKFWDDLRADPAAGAELLSAFGVPAAQARIFADALDEEMSDSILKLYRSATNIPGDWGPGTTPSDPGMVIGADSDPLVSAASSERAAAKAGAQVAILEGAGHWWPPGLTRGRGGNAPEVLGRPAALTLRPARRHAARLPVCPICTPTSRRSPPCSAPGRAADGASIRLSSRSNTTRRSPSLTSASRFWPTHSGRARSTTGDRCTRKAGTSACLRQGGSNSCWPIRRVWSKSWKERSTAPA